jgi:hypothetical protein
VLALLLATSAGAFAASQLDPQTAVAQLSAWRARVGVGAVAFDPDNTRGCQLHAEYFRQNGATGHSEDPGAPGYTPEGDAAARSSVLAYGAFAPGPLAWEDAVYHRTALLNPRLRAAGYWAEFGIGCMGVFATDDALVAPQLTAYPYPYDGQTGVATIFACNESPNPCDRVPGNGGTTPVGFVASVQFNGPWQDFQPDPRVDAASLTDQRGVAVAVTALDGASPDAWALDGGVAIVPQEPLAGGGSYTLSVQGTVAAPVTDAAGLPTGEVQRVPFASSSHFTTAESAAGGGSGGGIGRSGGDGDGGEVGERRAAATPSLRIGWTSSGPRVSSRSPAAVVLSYGHRAHGRRLAALGTRRAVPRRSADGRFRRSFRLRLGVGRWWVCARQPTAPGAGYRSARACLFVRVW